MVGDDPPDETVTILSDTLVTGTITVMNQGLLRVDGATLSLEGDLLLQDQGRFEMDSSELSVLADWLYEYRCRLSGDASLDIVDSRLSFGGQNWELVGIGSSVLEIMGSTFPAGFMTTLLLQEASMTVTGCTRPGEYIAMDSTSISFIDCDSILVWLNFPEGSSGLIELPGSDSLIVDWEFPGGSAGGIDYTIDVTNTTHMLSGVLSSNDSEVTIERSDLIALGIIFWEALEDTIHLAGLLNDSHYDDYAVPLTDRTLHLVDTHVNAWNVYPFDSTAVRIENSIFGETLADDDSRMEIWGSICDGRGGYVGSFGDAELIGFFSSILTHVNARNRSLMLFYESALLGQKVTVSGQAIMALLNTTPSVRPSVEDSALLAEAAIVLPAVTPAGSRIPVTGTAMITPAPFNPFVMDHYVLSYSAGYEPVDSGRVVIDSVHLPVMTDTLGVWDTRGLEPGPYTLELTVRSTFVDTFRVDLTTLEAVYLGEGTGIDRPPPEGGRHPRRLELAQNVPNPFNPNTRIGFVLEDDSRVGLRIYDVRGRLVRSLLDGVFPEGSHAIVWDGTDDRGSRLPSGPYFYRLETPVALAVRRMLLLR